jgi:hypothetical protein
VCVIERKRKRDPMGASISSTSSSTSTSTSSSIVEEIPACPPLRPFALIQAESSDNEPISILEAAEVEGGRGGKGKEVETYRNLIKRLKTLRHPRLLKLEWEQHSDGLCSLVVEKVRSAACTERESERERET